MFPHPPTCISFSHIQATGPCGILPNAGKTIGKRHANSNDNLPNFPNSRCPRAIPRPARHIPPTIGYEVPQGRMGGRNAARRSVGRRLRQSPVHHELDWPRLVANFYDAELPKPYLYPTPEGGVQAEWPIGSNEASLEIDLTTHTAEWYCLDFHADASTENLLDLDNAKSWDWITHELRRMEALTK